MPLKQDLAQNRKHPSPTWELSGKSSHGGGDLIGGARARLLRACPIPIYPHFSSPLSLPWDIERDSTVRARVCEREGVGGPRLIGSPLTLPPRTHEVTYLDWPFLFGRELGGMPEATKYVSTACTVGGRR